MADPNEITSCEYRFLSEEHFKELYETFIEAFSDYVIPFALTETQFRNHINLNAVDLTRSVGCFESGRLVGFSLNGFGEWSGRATVYDAGTGVLREFRRRGISSAMFEMMMPVFRSEGIKQYLLEVITANAAAISLYQKLGFRTVRHLALLQCDKKVAPSGRTPEMVEIRDIESPDWDLMTSFWDGAPSWQNSAAAVERSLKVKRIIGGYSGGRLIGYVVFSSKFGRVAQLAVDKQHRDRGIGTALIKAMRSEMDAGFSPQIINLDKSLDGAIEFFRKLGFYETLNQFEMVADL